MPRVIAGSWGGSAGIEEHRSSKKAQLYSFWDTAVRAVLHHVIWNQQHCTNNFTIILCMVQINSSTYTNNMNKNLRTINSALPVHYKCTLPRNTIVNMPQMSCYFSALINDSILYRASSSFFHDSAITGYEHIHPYEIFHNRKSHHLNFFLKITRRRKVISGGFFLLIFMWKWYWLMRSKCNTTAQITDWKQVIIEKNNVLNVIVPLAWTLVNHIRCIC